MDNMQGFQGNCGGVLTTHVLRLLLGLSAVVVGRCAKLPSSPLLQQLEMWNLHGGVVGDNSPETGVATPTMWLGLLATVVIMTMLLSMLSFPSPPMGCLLLETVVANVGMICDVVACIGSELAKVILLVACPAFKTGGDRGIIVGSVPGWCALQGSGHSNIDVVITSSTFVYVRCRTAVQINAKTLWIEVAPQVGAAKITHGVDVVLDGL